MSVIRPIVRKPIIEPLRGPLGTGLPWESGGGGVVEQLYGLQMTSGSMYGLLTTGNLNTAHAWMRVWWRSDATSGSGTKNICGTNNFGVAGVGLITETTAGANRAKIIGYINNKYTSVSAKDYHVPCDAEVGLVQCADVWCDGARIWLSIDGQAISIGTADATSSLATTNNLAINRRVSAATNGYGAMTIIGIQFSTTVPTQANLASSFRESPNAAIPGAIAHWRPRDLGLVGSTPSTWTDAIGGRVITLTGSPAVVAVNRVASKWASVVGVTAMATTTQDFASRHTAVGGQCLGPNNGTTPRLDTWVADLSVEGAVGTHAFLCYGINDLVYRIGTMGQTAAQAAAALLVDVQTAVTGFRSVRPSAVLLVQNVLRAGTGGSGITATVQSAIDLYNASLAAASLGTGIYVWDACTAVTPTQASADDNAVLYDDIHETAASKALHAVAATAAVTAAGVTHGVWEVYGDSIAAGRESGGSTDGGWRRAMVNALCAA